MGIFSKDRKDAKWVKPNDAIGAIVPFIMDKRTDSEVSSKVLIDVTKLCEFVDEQNKNGKLEYKMTYFHALAAAIGMNVFNRDRLNRFIKNRRLYQRNKITFAFVAKDKFSDKGEERLITIDLDPNDNVFDLSHKMAIDVFKARKEGTNDIDSILKFFTSLPKFVLSIIVSFVKFLDKHGWNPKSITEGDTNYATIILSNLGSIKTNSCYHHLTEYGTNSIVVTIGTIKEIDGKKTVDIWTTLDERIADGFYFAKSIGLIQYIVMHPELLNKKLNTKIEIENWVFYFFKRNRFLTK